MSSFSIKIVCAKNKIVINLYSLYMLYASRMNNNITETLFNSKSCIRDTLMTGIIKLAFCGHSYELDLIKSTSQTDQ